jgi:hypothetical protein
MPTSAKRRRRLACELEQDDVHWIASEGSILAPPVRAVVITIGLRLRSQGQWSKNWRADYGRTKQLRERTARALSLIAVDGVTEHLRREARVVSFTRLAPRLLDGDNLVAACKAIRDQVCCWLSGDNRPNARADDGVRSGFTFEYHQQQQRAYGVRVELRP